MIYYLGQRLVDFSLTPTPVNFIDTEVYVMEIVKDFQNHHLNYKDNVVSSLNKRTVQWHIHDFPQGVRQPHKECANLLFAVADPGFSLGAEGVRFSGAPPWIRQ